MGSSGICYWTLTIFNYINDLINSATKLSTILFADDTNMFCSGKDMHELETTVNSELAQVQEWLTLNQLTLNIYI